MGKNREQVIYEMEQAMLPRAEQDCVVCHGLGYQIANPTFDKCCVCEGSGMRFPQGTRWQQPRYGMSMLSAWLAARDQYGHLWIPYVTEKYAPREEYKPPKSHAAWMKEMMEEFLPDENAFLPISSGCSHEGAGSIAALAALDTGRSSAAAATAVVNIPTASTTKIVWKSPCAGAQVVRRI